MEENEPSPCKSPDPVRNPPSSSLRDISNFKTPRRSFAVNTNFLDSSPYPQFFTALRQTPKSSSSSFRRRPSLVPSSSMRSKAARRLKAFELQQSQSSRKAELEKKQSLRSLAKSLTVWLNFLFENPRSCGCYPLINDYGAGDVGYSGNAKRESGDAIRDSSVVRVDAIWRNPKRSRNIGWDGEEGSENDLSLAGSKYSLLKESLRDVCSLDDLKRRMRIYLSLGSCKEIFDVMTRVTKNIDEGRIKMKPHCPLVTDIGMKEKAIRTLMSYNQIWLRIGLYIIFGGDSLLTDVDADSDQELAFLKMVINKQFFAHDGFAKTYAYNKMVEGLYKPGYYEALGTVILKRVLLLVLIMDRAKSQSCLLLKYGIDGIDGGSPLLFSVKSSIKSSHQLISDLLPSDVMHGEGNLLAHLVIIGYKVLYEQSPLVEYDFRVKDLFVDLQDGVRICRAIQLLLHDSSILAKMVVPSDNRKKKLSNSGIALQYLKKAGVPLKDDEGMMIAVEDVVNGDKELTISLLWNIFVHLQLPLLINEKLLAEEICKVQGLDLDNQINMSTSPLEMLLKWIQSICKKYDFKLETFASLVDGKAIWFLLDSYFCREVCCPCLLKEEPNEVLVPRSVMWNTDYTDAVHNFILSQKLTALLGSFPEVLQIGDLLEQNAAVSDRSVIILLGFLSSKLIIKENMDQLNFHKLLCSNCQALERRYSRIGSGSSESAKREEADQDDKEDATKRFNAIKAWWQEMANQNQNRVGKATSHFLQCVSTSKSSMDTRKEKAATVIQAYLRGLCSRHRFTKMMNAICFLQTVVRIWLSAKQMQVLEELTVGEDSMLLSERCPKTESVRRYVKLIVARQRFIKLRKSVLVIQRAARNWISRVHRQDILPSIASETEREQVSPQELHLPHLDLEAAFRIQLAWRSYKRSKDRNMSAIVIQSYTRGWIARRTFTKYKYSVQAAAFRIQLAWRSYKRSKDENISVIVIQSYTRGWIARRTIKRYKCSVQAAALRIQLAWRSYKRSKDENISAIVIQSYARGWIARRTITRYKCSLQAALRIQLAWRSYKRSKDENMSAIVIQAYIRGWNARRTAKRYKCSALVIQRYCRGWLLRRRFLLQRESAICIQSALRRYNSLMPFLRYKHAATEVQRLASVEIARTRFRGASNLRTQASQRVSILPENSFQTNKLLPAVIKLQRWWRRVLSWKAIINSTVLIQRHIRGFITRRRISMERHYIVTIQSHWKGYITRKASRAQVMDLRQRMQTSAANVDDNKRLINKLLSALSELRNTKSVHNILHICETLDSATKYSEKCCEELVVAGAIDKLLTVIRSASRSIPDQEVSKHAFSTLRNLARYPHLTDELISRNGSIQTIFWELLRNKEEGYFIASDVLKKICTNCKGVEAVRKLPAYVKRLQGVVEELSRKATTEKRNAKGQAGRENSERRLREAAEILKLISSR
ncbi:PREDICTED: abnormal spindle-like microcephaly-associated protein homolog [Tarenaya hassleriana]|uniref:abnormal spindle-like microcephaly-associated protein homolog n=1 Tax=Tarenaya hassleriana TaxID=28532 RepID=UPI00053C64C7|nr:PREDICTED: abnormal spindle-like microcephaly-associated protein homolog [Tarenaya hassleriana]